MLILFFCGSYSIWITKYGNTRLSAFLYSHNQFIFGVFFSNLFSHSLFLPCNRAKSVECVLNNVDNMALWKRLLTAYQLSDSQSSLDTNLLSQYALSDVDWFELYRTGQLQSVYPPTVRVPPPTLYRTASQSMEKASFSVSIFPELNTMPTT